MPDQADRLDQLIEHLVNAEPVADTGEPAALAVLVAVGRDLLDLPREAFRDSLAQQLERSTPMPSSPSYIPVGLSPVTPYLLVRDPAAAVQFYEDVFAATEVMRHDVDGQVVHAKISIGNAVVELGQHGERTDADVGDLPSIGMHLFVEDVDAVHARAVAAGARPLSPIEDQYYGDREVSIADPFGIVWFVATHIHD